MSKKILIVEDNRENGILMKKILTHFGYEVTVLEDGKDVLPYCESNEPPSMILMDISLPSIDGLELTKQIKKLSSYSVVPIAAVSAFEVKEVEQKVKNAGCVALLTKPFTPDSLNSFVGKYAA